MSNRRYADDEVREIFTLATTGPAPDRSLAGDSDGLTLGELQRIAQEAGIEPSRVAQAAATLDARGRPAPVRRAFGMPVGVSRVVDLPRAPSDQEWEHLVSLFRTTFGTRGEATTTGNFREWSHGNLHMCVEPTGRGHQLRMGTVKGDAMALNAFGLLMGGMSIVMGAAVAVSGQPEKALTVIVMFGGMALAAFGANVFRLPRWARERERQLESIAGQTVALLRTPGDDA